LTTSRAAEPFSMKRFLNGYRAYLPLEAVGCSAGSLSRFQGLRLLVGIILALDRFARRHSASSLADKP
jgi:hypothetical protein